jgi:catechol 2,3-dioxygenase-like lactoylglutathione lyase family enzyme
MFPSRVPIDMSELQIHHTGLVVTDLEEALSFYRDTLGFDVIETFTLSGDGIGTAIDVDGVAGEFAHLETDGSRLELIEYEPAGEHASPDAVNQIGATHLGFEVEDIDTFYTELPDEAEPVSDPQEVGVGIEILFFRDPDGNFVEVLEG